MPMTGDTEQQDLARFETQFLIILLVLALGGLLWLFTPFLTGLFMAMVVAVATWPFYQRLHDSWHLTPERAAALMTLLILILVIAPLVYLILSSVFRIGYTVDDSQKWLASLSDASTLQTTLQSWLGPLPLPKEVRERVLAEIMARHENLTAQGARLLLSLLKMLTSQGLTFLASLGLMLFALYFFYRDGPRIVRYVKVLTPLDNRFDDVMFSRFAALAFTLTLSTVGIALLEGISFSLVTAFMGLPWFYLGVALAMASFIPVVGGLLVWGPLAWVLYWHGHQGQAFFLIFWGAFVIGFCIDSLLRPLLVGRLGTIATSHQAGGPVLALNYTLLTVLSTFGGVIHFGILGLLFGPIIAAMAITIFDIYEMKYGAWLDRS
ncbi:MAG: AI-2E family transporter [Magnetococcus sp. DMHC-1]|nr:AI-2E family transporter [Magnetococcales bacterium]